MGDRQTRECALRKSAFLAAFSEHGIVKKAAEVVGISSWLVYDWRKRDEEFAAKFAEAEQDAADVIEAELHRRAVVGVDEPVIFQGVPSMVTDPETGEQRVLTVKKYSDPLLLSLIKARKPQKYRENTAVAHQFEGTTGVLVIPAAVSPEDWAKAAEAQQAKFAGNTGEKK